MARAFDWERNWRALRRRGHAGGKRTRASEGSVLGTRTPPQQTSECHRGRAYDSNPLRERLHRRGIELLVPQRRNRERWWRQDGRKLRRYKKRRKVERTFAWLQNFRRLLVRYDRILSIPRLLSFRLLTDHPQVFMKPLL